jgi:hypothetical protein
MNIEIFPNPTHDPGFVELAKTMIVQLFTQSQPEKSIRENSRLALRTYISG